MHSGIKHQSKVLAFEGIMNIFKQDYMVSIKLIYNRVLTKKKKTKGNS